MEVFLGLGAAPFNTSTVHDIGVFFFGILGGELGRRRRNLSAVMLRDVHAHDSCIVL